MSYEELSVVTLNALNNKFMLEERIERIAYELLDLHADVVMLQEIFFEEDGSSPSLQTICDITGLNVVAVNPVPIPNRAGFLFGTAILSHYDVIESGVALKPDNDKPNDTCYSIVEANNSRPIIIFSTHGTWGGTYENFREQQAYNVNLHAEELLTKYQDRNPIALWAGDFNAVSESSTVRYITGLGSVNNSGTFWVDAWDYSGDKTEGYTSRTDLLHSINTANKVGITRPELIPHRRIDYLFVHGWAYGRPGCPLSTKLVMNSIDDAGYTVSDHLGIHSVLWNPNDYS